MWLAMFTVALAADGEALKQAATLPVLAHDLRQNGVAVDDVKTALDAALRHDLPAEQAAEALAEAKKDVDTHGPVDNFGAFVQARLDEGLRGKELAAAIRAEHEAHGKGKGHGKKPDAKGPHGKPDDVRSPHGKGAPEGKGPDGKRPDGKGPDGKGPDGKGKAGPHAADGAPGNDKVRGKPSGKGDNGKGGH